MPSKPPDGPAGVDNSVNSVAVIYMYVRLQVIWGLFLILWEIRAYFWIMGRISGQYIKICENKWILAKITEFCRI